MLDKVTALRRELDHRGLDVDIEVDGGVKLDNVGAIAAAGANVLVAGSAVFRGGSVSNSAPYGENIRAIREAAEAALR